MTLTQAEWIQYWWGKEDHDIYEVITKIIDQNKLDCIDQDRFQEIYDKYDNMTIESTDKDITSVYRNLLSSYKRS